MEKNEKTTCCICGKESTSYVCSEECRQEFLKKNNLETFDCPFCNHVFHYHLDNVIHKDIAMHMMDAHIRMYHPDEMKKEMARRQQRKGGKNHEEER